MASMLRLLCLWNYYSMNLIIMCSRHLWRTLALKRDCSQSRIVIPTCTIGYGNGARLPNERNCLL